MKNWHRAELLAEEKARFFEIASHRTQKEESGCWRWLGSPRGDGYGQLMIVGRVWAAHRASYCAHAGPIPENMCLLHSCDNRWCVNPAHLQLGTRAENTADMVRKRRAAGAKGEKHSMARLTEADVIMLRRMTWPDHESFANAAITFGVDESTIRNAVRRKTWTHVP